MVETVTGSMAEGTEVLMKPPFDRKFGKFIEYLLGNEEPCKIAAQLQREGVNLLRVFVELRVYVEGRSIAKERQKRGKDQLKIINRGVRENGLAPAVGRWLRDRSELAHSINGLSRAHNVDSLGAVHIYLEERTGRKVTVSDLAYLVDAANWSLGRKVGGGVVDPKILQHELARWRKNNPRFVEILKADIESKL
jgi:hypothetical protein